MIIVKKPKIRFKGFTETWEQRKLSELLVERNVQHSQSEEFPLVSFTVENGVTPKTERYEREQLVRGDKSAKKYKETRLDDIVYNPANLKFGAISRNKLGNAVFSPIYVTFEVKKDLVKPSFIEMVVKKKNFIQKALQYQQGTVYERMAVNTEDFTNLDVYIPNDLEQVKIGNYFENLDHLITLHQRKCENLKKLKKFMLQKLFPQNGENVPKIRFTNFTDTWEQRKLSEIALQTYGGGTPKTANEEFWKGNIPWIQSSDLIEERLFNVKPRKYISQEAISKSSTKLVPQNSITIVTRVGVGKLAFMPFSYATSQDFLSLSELKIEPKFAVYALYKMMRLVSNEVQGTSIKGITKDELLAKEILIPDCEVQKKIGAYLHNLDNLITLHQSKCDNLKEVKKYMLQNMFI